MPLYAGISSDLGRCWPISVFISKHDTSVNNKKMKKLLRFHTIYWPIILHCLGLELPKQIFGHPWLLSNTDKMSKSKGNIVYADDLVSEFGVDAVRYYFLHEIPFGSDGTFTTELLIYHTNLIIHNQSTKFELKKYSLNPFGNIFERSKLWNFKHILCPKKSAKSLIDILQYNKVMYKKQQEYEKKTY